MYLALPVIMKTLYFSYDGMTDNLGQSQVIPYLAGLSTKGYEITLFSFEKEERFEDGKEKIEQLLKSHNITWKPLPYTKSPPILSTIKDIFKLRSEARKLAKTGEYKIVHCRGYITALVGLHLQRKFGLKFIFDMRAFYADERVDGNLWDTKKWIYRKVYEFFKRKEVEFLSNADYSITLTHKAKTIIHGWNNVQNQPVPIQVIPCCADLDHFRAENVNTELRKKFMDEIGILDNDLVITYLGSIGTWYMLDEMLDFFRILLRSKPNALLLFITPDKSGPIIDSALERGITIDRLAVISGQRNEVPTLLSLGHLSLFFIKPVFSKQGSSPTKHGEILGMGIPVICNAGVGDVDDIIEATQSGIVVKEFNATSYQKAINHIDEYLAKDKQVFRDAAEKVYSLKEGVENYTKVYKTITGQA